MSNINNDQSGWDVFFDMAHRIQEPGESIVISKDNLPEEITFSELHQKYQEVVMAKRVAERRLEALQTWLAFCDKYQSRRGRRV